MAKPFSSIFPNPHRVSESLDEENAKRFIDTLLGYRRKEILFMFAVLWGVFLFMVFSLLITVRLAFLIF